MPQLGECMREISSMRSFLATPTIPLMVIVVAMAFPVLYVYAQGQTGVTTSPPATGTGDSAASLANVVNSIAVIVGVIVPLIVSGAAYVKSRTQDPRIQDAADTAISVGQLATAMANKALENKQHIKDILEVAVKLAPEDAKKFLAENQEKINQLDREIQATTAQIKRLRPTKKEADADTIPDLPRETPPTTPTR